MFTSNGIDHVWTIMSRKTEIVFGHLFLMVRIWKNSTALNQICFEIYEHIFCEQIQLYILQHISTTYVRHVLAKRGRSRIYVRSEQKCHHLDPYFLSSWGRRGICRHQRQGWWSYHALSDCDNLLFNLQTTQSAETLVWQFYICVIWQWFLWERSGSCPSSGVTWNVKTIWWLYKPPRDSTQCLQSPYRHKH